MECEKAQDHEISKETVRHIWEKHRDLVKALKARSPGELVNAIMKILRQPDEIYRDKFRNSIKYYLKKLNDHWVNIVLVGSTIKTAYLIGLGRRDGVNAPSHQHR